MRPRLGVLVAVCVFASLAATAHASRIIDLGPVRNFPPVAVNDSRVVVGGSPTASNNQPSPNGTYVYYDGTFYAIPQFLAPGSSRGSGAADINDANLVVGYSTTDAGSTAGFISPHPFTWKFDPADPSASPPLTALATIPSFNRSGVALGVNNAGDVVGQSAQPLDPTGHGSESTFRRAVVWAHGQTGLQQLEPSASGNSLVGEASDLNDRGTIIGALDVGSGSGTGALWTGAAHTRTALPARPPETTPGGPAFTGHPINSAGDYVLTPPDQKAHFFDNDPIALQPGFSASTIADNGRVFGGLDGAATVIERDGTVTNLNTLNPAGSPFSTLTRANDVNRLGDVLGVGTVNGVADGFLLLADAWIVNDGGDAPDTDTTDAQCLTAAGRCTLRAALQQTNASGGDDVIRIGFAIPGTPTITPASPLPPIARNHVLVDGRTQAGGPVTLTGTAVSTDDAGLRVLASDVAVKGMTISGFGGPGVQVGAAGTSVAGVLIGGRPSASDRCAFPCNTLAGNHGGVVVLGTGTAGVNAIGNALTDDGAAPIDLGGDGPTADDDGDGDDGPNGLANFPVGVTAAIDPVSGDQTISGAVTPEVSGAVVDIYAQAAPGTPARAAPTSFIGTAVTGPAGAFTFVVAKADIDASRKFFSATAALGGSGSELSAVCGDPDGNGDPDDDGDGLCDSWEANGLDYDGDGAADLAFPGADPNVKDLYLEVDSMRAPSHTIAPTQAALDQVIQAFANAPVDAGKGIRLHVDRDETDLPEHDPIDFSGSDAFPDTLKAIRDGQPSAPCDGSFGTVAERARPTCWATLGAKHLTTRWALFAETYTEDPDSGGRADGIGGTSLAVTLGSALDAPSMIINGGGPAHCADLARCVDNVNAATLMHELGHLLGLHHGGGDDVNDKPNYLSIMNYAFAYAGESPDRALDYSNWRLDTLDENAIDETKGVLGGKSFDGLLARFPYTVYTTKRDGRCRFASAATSGAIDFDDDGALSASTTAAVNDGANAKPSHAPADCQVGGVTALTGYDDWQRLHYSFRDQRGFVNAAAPTGGDLVEPTIADQVAIAHQIDTDGDGVDNASEACRMVPGTGFTDADADGVIDACETAAPTPSSPLPSQTAPGLPGVGTRPDTTAPVVSGLRLGPARFRAASKGASLGKATKRTGAKLSLIVSEPARLTFAVQRLTKGHVRRRHCRAGGHAGRSCTLAKRLAGSFALVAKRAGTSRAAFTGRLSGKALKRGRYRLVATATDAAGNTSRPARAAFRIR